MGVSRFWMTLLAPSAEKMKILPEKIESVQQFHRTLERERNRADRSGSRFTILSIEYRSPTGQVVLDDNFLEYLLDRVRSSDTVGWLDENHLGVLLPDTSEEGTRVLAGDLCSVNGEKVNPVFRIYTYPSEMVPGKRRFSTRNKTEEGSITSSRDDTKTDWSLTENLSGTSSVRQTACARQYMWDINPQVTGLEPIFQRRMPCWKRGMDVTLSLLGLIILSPVFLVVAAMIKMVSPGPVFFKQERVGCLGKIFKLYKFRTMHVDADQQQHRQLMNHLIENDTPMVKLDAAKDPRIIRFGRFLRATCIDELPQLINVLRGDMSLVGPRPCLPYEAEEYLRWHARRFDIVPGITGLWQVNGKNRTTFKEMIRYDIEYANKLSLWLDLKILLKTIPAILSSSVDVTAKPQPMGVQIYGVSGEASRNRARIINFPEAENRVH